MQTDGRVRGGLVTDASGARVLICTALVRCALAGRIPTAGTCTLDTGPDKVERGCAGDESEYAFGRKWCL